MVFYSISFLGVGCQELLTAPHFFAWKLLKKFTLSIKFLSGIIDRKKRFSAKKQP